MNMTTEIAKKQISMYKRYWIYSDTEAVRLKEVNDQINVGGFKLGTVINENGIIKSYTSMVNDLSKVTYADAIVVMEGDIRRVKYTPIQY